MEPLFLISPRVSSIGAVNQSWLFAANQINRNVIDQPDRLPVHVSTEETNTISLRWQTLMLAAQAGEPRQYSQLLREVTPFIRAISRRYSTDAAAIEDTVQETLTSIHRMRHTYEPGRPVEPWIAAIAKARAIDALRQRSRKAKREEAFDPDRVEILPDGAMSPEMRLVTRSAIEEALSQLTEPQRAAIRLLKIDELSLSEASARSGLSVQALKSALHRAMTTLRAHLTGHTDA